MFVIVKYAAKNYESQWGDMKPSEGVFANHSIHNTKTGKHLDIKPYYLNKEEAEADLKLTIDENPCGGYAVCPVLPFWSDKVQEIFLSAFASMKPNAPTMKVLFLDQDGLVCECFITGFSVQFVGGLQNNLSRIRDIDLVPSYDTSNFRTPMRARGGEQVCRVFTLSIDF